MDQCPKKEIELRAEKRVVFGQSLPAVKREALLGLCKIYLSSISITCLTDLDNVIL